MNSVIAWLIAGLVGFAVIFLSFWNRRLRRAIAQYRQTEADLRSSEARFNRLLENLHGTVYCCALDQHWTMEFLSDGIEMLSGYPAHDFIDNQVRSYASLIHPDDQALVDRCIQEAVTAHRSYALEYRIRHADGETRWICEKGRAIPDEPGDIIHLAGTFLDITERKCLQAALERKRALYNALFETNNAIKLLIDPADGRILDANSAASAFYGYSREQLLRLHISQINTLSQAEIATEMAQARIRNKHYFVSPHRLANDEIRTVEVYSSPVELDGRQLLFSIIHDITDRQRTEQALQAHQQQLEWLTHYDSLTALPNRVLLADRMQVALAQANRARSLLAVCYLDLDGFKPINEALGHEVGDGLLIEVAHRLQNALRGGDTVARLGGDEFVLLLTDFDTVESCEHALARLLRTLSAPYIIVEQKIILSASIGVTLYPLDAGDPDELVRHADQAMYVAKQQGRNCYRMFDSEHDRRARLHRETLERIEQALHQQEFRLYYQPKVDMRRGIVIGAEALIRWQHPERGLAMPGDFLPAIETNNDLTVALGHWVLADALRQIAAWQQQGLTLPVSVNIAARHLLHSDFVNRLITLLKAHPTVDPARLELEILETATLEDMELANRIIWECRQMGVKIALDDFGTGYSSLTYFKKLPVNILKIDQSFVRDMLDDPEDLTIVAGVVGLAVAFQREVIAEGVETPRHGLLLLQLGCDLAQGYGIARPMPSESVVEWVRNFQPDPLWAPVRHRRWNREDFPLLAGTVEHRRWITKLTAWIASSMLEESPPTLNARECRFGLWYYGLGQNLYGHLEIFQVLETMHKDLHELGCMLVEMRRNGSIEQVHLVELDNLNSQLLTQFHIAQMAVAMVDPVVGLPS
ncbi:MAG: hypothetical protein QG599_2811 [Pseudomonadota bacterium]|nr:hypothetical protein [Pseudomonadota bacterium]